MRIKENSLGHEEAYGENKWFCFSIFSIDNNIIRFLLKSIGSGRNSIKSGSSDLPRFISNAHQKAN